MSCPSRRPEGSSPLHNFSLPPSLKWGAQKLLRCSKSSSIRRSADDTEALRGKLMRDLRTAATTSPGLDEEDEDDESAAARPWNLRTRRAACRAPGDSGGGDRNREASLSPMTLEKGSSRRNRDSEKRGRAKFSIELSREEVELDYLVMLGNRPPRRPKKRSKMVQRQIEFVYPGLWLTEITMDRYKVPDCVELVKNLQA